MANNYDGMTLDDLQVACDDKGIGYVVEDTRDDLIAKLEAAPSVAPVKPEE
ncbi:MAG: hypothetical protein ACWGQW_25460 [bacterium]